MNVVTGYRGEPHITSQQDQAKNQGIFGSGSYVLDVGQKLRAEAVSANEVRIYDGVLSHQGVVAVVEKNTYDSVTITSGSHGADRCDLIVARYTKEGSTGVESMTFAVIMGTEGDTTPPAYNEGDIQAGDSPVDMPIYEVHLSGIEITDLTPVFGSISGGLVSIDNAFICHGNLPSCDLDDVIVPGAYSLISGNTYINAPQPPVGNLRVYYNADGWKVQLFDGTGGIYTRIAQPNRSFSGKWVTVASYTGRGYQKGVNYTSEQLYGAYGHVTNGSTVASVSIPFRTDDADTINITKLVCSLRINGSYVGGSNLVDLTRYITGSTIIKNQGLLQITLTNSSGWNVPNNNVLSGIVVADFKLL